MKLAYGSVMFDDRAAKDWLAKPIDHFVGGKWLKSKNYQLVFDIFGDKLTEIAIADEEIIKQAREFKNKLNQKEKIEALKTFSQVIAEDTVLPVLISLLYGFPIKHSLDFFRPVIAKQFATVSEKQENESNANEIAFDDLLNSTKQLAKSVFSENTIISGSIIATYLAKKLSEHGIAINSLGTDHKESLKIYKPLAIITEDADVDSATAYLVEALLLNKERLGAFKILVQENIRDQLAEKLMWRLEKLIVGDLFDLNTDFTLINKIKSDELDSLIAQYRKQNIWQPSWKDDSIAPTLFLQASTVDSVSQTDLTGPNALTMTFRTNKEASELANNLIKNQQNVLIWSENINALELASDFNNQKVAINCSNLINFEVKDASLMLGEQNILID